MLWNNLLCTSLLVLEEFQPFETNISRAQMSFIHTVSYITLQSPYVVIRKVAGIRTDRSKYARVQERGVVTEIREQDEGAGFESLILGEAPVHSSALQVSLTSCS